MKKLSYFQVFLSQLDKQYYWRLRDGENHKILAVGGESFPTDKAAWDSIAHLLVELEAVISNLKTRV